MKKIALLLALVLCFALVGCDSEEANEKKGAVEVPGSNVSFDAEGWDTVEHDETAVVPYEVEMTRDGVTMVVEGFSPTDFVMPPTAAEMFDDRNEFLLRNMTDVQVIEEVSSSTVDGRTTFTAMFSAKNGDKTEYFYTLLVEFEPESSWMSWVAFSGTKEKIEGTKDQNRAIVDGMVCDTSAIPEVPEFDEDGNLVTEPVDYDVPEDTQPMESMPDSPPAPTEVTEAPAPEPTEAPATTEATKAE